MRHPQTAVGGRVASWLATSLAVSTLAVSVLGTAAGCVAGADPGPTLTSGPTASPSRTGPPDTTPATEATGPSPDLAIPDGVFLALPTNLQGGVKQPKPENGPAHELSLCKAHYPSDGLIGQRRGRTLMYYAPGSTSDNVPDGTVAQTITVYRPNGATAAMRELRSALTACPRDTTDNGSTLSYRLPIPKHYGDDTILIEETWNGAAESTNPPVSSLFYVVRISNVITILQLVGWEGLNAAPATADEFTTRAVEAVHTWAI
jgi:hypothetical protein